jgi:seryl-tRNA synthetase
MLDPQWIWDNPDAVQRAADQKRIRIDLPEFLQHYGIWKTLLPYTEELAHEQKLISSEIEKLATEKRHKEIKPFVEKAREIKAKLAGTVPEVEASEKIWRELILYFPQPADEDVPIGETSDDNVVIKTWSPERGAEYPAPYKAVEHTESKAERALRYLESLGKQYLAQSEKGGTAT